jgi:hypothetical protein
MRALRVGHTLQSLFTQTSVYLGREFVGRRARIAGVSRIGFR